MDKEKSIDLPRKRSCWRWFFWSIAAFVLLVIMTIFCFWFNVKTQSKTTYVPKDIIGDLGGIKVKIPYDIPELVEYNGDPGWGGVLGHHQKEPMTPS